VWWAEAEDKRRPVLIVTRSDAIPVLRRLVVAPVTRTVRGIPTEIALGSDEGMPVECVASFDNLQPVNRRLLTELTAKRVPSDGGERMKAGSHPAPARRPGHPFPAGARGGPVGPARYGARAQAGAVTGAAAGAASRATASASAWPSSASTALPVARAIRSCPAHARCSGT
jgi:mRNA interferase MazF